MPRAEHASAEHPSSGPLRGRTVVITRPAHQAEGLARRVERLGGRAVRVPALAIEPAVDARAAAALLAAPGAFRAVIFVSANAVEHGLALRAGAPWPAATPVLAVGEATAQALRARGLAPQLPPGGCFDSEGLLALPALAEGAVRGARVLVVRGTGGRELIAETLRARGAEVAYAEVYRRVRPPPPAGSLRDRVGCGCVVITSAEAAQNLFAMLEAADRRWLAAQAFVAVSPRVAQALTALGVRRAPLVAAGAGDAAVIDALCRWAGAEAD